MAAELRAMRMIICSLVAAGLRGDKLRPSRSRQLSRQADRAETRKGKEAVVEFVTGQKRKGEDDRV